MTTRRRSFAVLLAACLALPSMAHGQAGRPCEASAAASSPPGIDAHSVVPVVRSSREIEALAPEVRGALYLGPLTSALIVLLADGSGKEDTLLTREQVAALGWRAEDLKMNSLRNLACEMSKARIIDSGGVFMVASGGRHEASLLIATPVWRSVVPALKGRPVIGVPNRDVFLITGSEDVEGLARLRKTVRGLFAGGDHPLTDHLFLVTDEGITLFE